MIDTSTKFAQWLIDALRLKNISEAELARRSSMTRQAINNYTNGKIQNPDAVTLAKIAHGLGENPEVVFRAAGILARKGVNDHDSSLAYRISQLSDEDKEVIEALVETLNNRRETKNGSRSSSSPASSAGEVGST